MKTITAARDQRVGVGISVNRGIKQRLLFFVALLSFPVIPTKISKVRKIVRASIIGE